MAELMQDIWQIVTSTFWETMIIYGIGLIGLCAWALLRPKQFDEFSKFFGKEDEEHAG